MEASPFPGGPTIDVNLVDIKLRTKGDVVVEITDNMDGKTPFQMYNILYIQMVGLFLHVDILI
jgi:hypothetical protein